jgi:CubicO group peptidase (beta-lactamase class C family)
MIKPLYLRTVKEPLAAIRLAVLSLVFALLTLALIFGAAGPVAAEPETVDQRIRRVEDGLRMPYVVEGYDEYRTTYDIYERMKHHRVPGVSICVINGGRIEWAKGYGELKAGTGRIVNTETLFQVASIGKPITAAGALRLVEQGVLDLGGDVNDYLSSWEIPKNEFTYGIDLTLEMLLSHTGGVTVHGFPGYPQGSSLPTLKQILQGEPPCNTPAVSVDIKPGTRWRYSGGGFVIVQQIFEDLFGKPFPQSMRELVFEPAAMHRTFYFPRLPEALEENAALAHLADGSPVAGGYHIYPEFGAGAGLWSTPLDLARFVVGIQDSYTGRPGGLLGRDTAIEMLKQRMGPHGLGFMVVSKSGEVALSHGGGNLGYRNLLFAYAETGKGAVVMTNSDVGDNICSEILRAIAVVYGWPDYQPERKVPVRLPAERLDALAGHYDIPGLGPVLLWVEGGNLYAPDLQIEGGRILFLPESPTSFFSPSSGWLLDFVLDESGAVTGVDVQLDGMKITAKRMR